MFDCVASNVLLVILDVIMADLCRSSLVLDAITDTSDSCWSDGWSSMLIVLFSLPLNVICSLYWLYPTAVMFRV